MLTLFGSMLSESIIIVLSDFIRIMPNYDSMLLDIGSMLPGWFRGVR